MFIRHANAGSDLFRLSGIFVLIALLSIPFSITIQATPQQCGQSMQPSCVSLMNVPLGLCVNDGYRLDDPNTPQPFERAGAEDHGFGVSQCARFVGISMQLNYVALQAQRPAPGITTAVLKVYFGDNLAFGDLRPGVLIDSVSVPLPTSFSSTDFQLVPLDSTYDTQFAGVVWLEMYFPPTSNGKCMGTRGKYNPGQLGESFVVTHEAVDSLEIWKDYEIVIPDTSGAYNNHVPVLRPLQIIPCQTCIVDLQSITRITSENGDSAEFQCALTAPPFDTVYVNLASTDTTEGIVRTTQLLFDPPFATIPQTFWVIGQDDTLHDGDITYHVQGTASSNDLCYDGVVGQASATNLDNEPKAPETVHVGDPGNPDDLFGFGGVLYEYDIGRYEVTNAEYVDFLNAVGASDSIGLYDPNMGTDIRGGITRSGSFGSYTYAARPNMGNKPVNYVSLYDCMRFVNWLDNGLPSGSIDPTTTEDGSYDMSGVGSIIGRKPSGTWFVPTIDELYKAAFYDPVSVGADSGITPDYWQMPNSSNLNPPIPASADSVGNVSNPGYGVMNFDNSATWNGVTGNVTTVGSTGPSTATHYGAYDMGGNIAEWNDVQFISSGMIYATGENGAGYGPGLVPNVGQYPQFAHLVDENNVKIGFRVVKAPPACQCGDANGDGVISIGDAVFIINYIFGGGLTPCNGDADGSGTVSIGDAVVIVSYIFGGGPPPTCP